MGCIDIIVLLYLHSICKVTLPNKGMTIDNPLQAIVVEGNNCSDLTLVASRIYSVSEI